VKVNGIHFVASRKAFKRDVVSKRKRVPDVMDVVGAEDDDAYKSSHLRKRIKLCTACPVDVVVVDIRKRKQCVAAAAASDDDDDGNDTNDGNPHRYQHQQRFHREKRCKVWSVDDVPRTEPSASASTSTSTSTSWIPSTQSMHLCDLRLRRVDDDADADAADVLDRRRYRRVVRPVFDTATMSIKMQWHTVATTTAVGTTSDVGYELSRWIRASPSHVYVGRHSALVAGTVASKWSWPDSLPTALPAASRARLTAAACAVQWSVDDDAAAAYAHWLLVTSDLARHVHELAHSTLGCWCRGAHGATGHAPRCPSPVLIRLVRAAQYTHGTCGDGPASPYGTSGDGPASPYGTSGDGPASPY
jgi:hypothetical protein